MKISDLFKLNKFVIIFLIVVMLTMMFAIGLTASVIFNSLFDDIDSTKPIKPIKIEDDIIKSIKGEYKSDDYEIKIIDVDKDYTEEFMYKENNDYRVVVVNLEIKNKLDKDFIIGSFLAKNDKGEMLTRNFTKNNSIDALAVLLPDTVLNGSISFELPKDSKSMVLTYKDTLGNDNLNFNIDVNK